MILFKTFMGLMILVLGLAYYFRVERRINWYLYKKENFDTTNMDAPLPLQYTKPGKVDDPNYVNSDNIIYLKNQVDELVTIKQQIAELQKTSKEQGVTIQSLGPQLVKEASGDKDLVVADKAEITKQLDNSAALTSDKTYDQKPPPTSTTTN
jgi:hypothetical protein